MVKSKSNNPFNKVCRCSNNNNNSIDRISNLPEDLLSQILSLLPLESAVETSVLSTRWKFLWTNITNFDCTCPHRRRGRYASKLALTIPKLYVNRLLQLLNPSSIKKFRLDSCNHCFDPSYLYSMVSAGFGGSAQEFELYCMSKEFIELPLSQIYCNLLVLKLQGRIRFNVPTSASICFPSLQSLRLSEVSLSIPSNSSISFPKLKIMDLKYVEFANENSLQKLFSNSPVLDELIIKRDDRDQIKSLIICVPSITRLSIEFVTDCFSNFNPISFSRVVQIDCPALQYLNIHDEVPCLYLPTKNSFSLLQANVRMLFESDSRRPLYVSQTSASICFPSLQSLRLSEVSLSIPSNSSISFPKLKIMDLKYVEFANENSLQKLFSNSPVLDELIIKRDDRDQIKSLIICVPSITRLSIEFVTDCFSNFNPISFSRVVQIDCPALQYLNIHDEVPCLYLPTKNSFSLLQANVRMLFESDSDDNEENCISITKFIGSLTNVKVLSVSGDVLKAFRIASANILSGFHNLTHLEMEVDDCIDFYVVINKILGNTDNLEHIVMKGSMEWSSSCSCQSWWTEPLNTPKCLLSRVTVVSFSYMVADCCCDKLELLRYILKNAGVLQMLTIDTRQISKKRQHELSNRISFMPRVSKTCQVAFI